IVCSGGARPAARRPPPSGAPLDRTPEERSCSMDRLPHFRIRRGIVRWSGFLLLLLATLLVGGSARAAVIEGFESGNLALYTAPLGFSGWSVTNAAAHDGNFGAQTVVNQSAEWIYRNDAPVTVSQGDQLSVWMQPNGGANGRSYFGFGA